VGQYVPHGPNPTRPLLPCGTGGDFGARAMTRMNLVPVQTIISTAVLAGMIACNSGGQTSSTPREWYVGGTLHDKTIAEWRTATYPNRLATSADFVIGVGNFQSLPPDLKKRAIELEACISTAVQDGFTDHWTVSATGAPCAVLLGY